MRADGDVFANRDKMLKAIDEAKQLAADQPEMLKSIDAMLSAANVFHEQLTVPQLEARKTTEKPISEVIEIGRNQSKGQLDVFRVSAATIKKQAGEWAAEQVAQHPRAFPDVEPHDRAGPCSRRRVAVATHGEDWNGTHREPHEAMRRSGPRGAAATDAASASRRAARWRRLRGALRG